MVKKAFITTLVCISIYLVSGCGSDNTQKQGANRITKEKYEQLAFEMTYEEISKILGGPGTQEKFPNQPDHEILYRWDDPETSYYIYVTFVENKAKALAGYE